jgi:hypothetical protein
MENVNTKSDSEVSCDNSLNEYHYKKFLCFLLMVGIPLNITTLPLNLNLTSHNLCRVLLQYFYLCFDGYVFMCMTW